MNIIKLIVNGIVIVGVLLAIYMLADLFYRKNTLKKDEIKTVNNTKYIVIIVIIIVMFIVYGILRNFA